MDIRDRTGDVISTIHEFNPKSIAVVAYITHTIGLTILFFRIHKSLDIIIASLMTLILILSVLTWFNFKKYKVAIILMKLQFVSGIYFLV